MRRGKVATIMSVVGGGLLLCAVAATARAQEEVRLQTVSAYIGLEEKQPVYPRITYISSQACITADCAVSATFPAHINHTATLSASRFSVSGSHYCTYTPNKFWGTSIAKYVMKVYSKVVPGGKLRVKVRGSLALSWSNLHADNSAYARVYFADPAGSGPAAVGYNSSGVAGQASGEKMMEGDTYATTESLQPDYYYIGSVTLESRSYQPDVLDGGANVTFNSSVNENIEVFYRGNALKIYDAASNNQTWFVDKELPKALSVIVADGETGTPVPGGIPITFTIVEPSNGAKFSNGQTTMGVNTVNGIAGASLTLGNSPGTYTVKATCPADVCISGAKEVVLTASAIQNHTDVTGMVPEGCSQVTIGNITALVDPVTNTFRLPNVPLTISPQVGILLSELEIKCNNDAECPVANVQRMPASCAGGAFGASRSRGRSHAGVDLLTVNDATPVLSATTGRVIHVGLFNDDRTPNESWGWIVVIQSARRILNFYEVLLYGHLDPDLVSVSAGDNVSAGQQIAVTGRYTGNLTNPLRCPHVHVERRLLSSPLAIVRVPIPCAGASLQCNGGDMNSNENGSLFGSTRPTNPDTEIGCNIYR